MQKIGYAFFTVSLYVPVEQDLPQGYKGLAVVNLGRQHTFKRDCREWDELSIHLSFDLMS